MLVVATVTMLLSRYTGQYDLMVGTPIAGRNRAELEDLIGLFVNTLVLRADLAGNPTFGELLGRVRDLTLGAYAHQDLPFEKLVEEIQPERNLSQTPLFQVMTTVDNNPATSHSTPEQGGKGKRHRRWRVPPAVPSRCLRRRTSRSLPLFARIASPTLPPRSTRPT